LLLVFSLSALADTAWTEDDRDLALASGALLALDWHTTRTLAENNWCGHHCFETNPMLGRYPSARAVDRHFMLTPLIFMAADQFPEYRHSILMGTVIVESIAVTNNMVKFGWSWRF